MTPAEHIDRELGYLDEIEVILLPRAMDGDPDAIDLLARVQVKRELWEWGAFEIAHEEPW